MKAKKNCILILDANVLIDFINCDKSIIKLICSYIGQIYLPSPILDEINNLSDNDCIELPPVK